MIWLLATVAIVLIIAFAVLFYFFRIAFLRILKRRPLALQGTLDPYAEIITKGIDYINETEHKWVYTKSFDGLKLAARYYNNKSDKTIILFHGYRSSSVIDFSCAVEFYMNLGFNILLVDQRSHGKSEGKFITFGVKERYDVLRWVEFINKRYNVERIVISGISMGATTVMMAANLELPSNVCCIISDCGFTSPVDIIKRVAKRNFKINGGFIIPILNIGCRLFGGFDIYKISTVDTLANSKLPILFIHGKADDFVPCEMSELSFKAAAGEKKILIVEGAGHGLSFLIDTENVKSQISEFINSH